MIDELSTEHWTNDMLVRRGYYRTGRVMCRVTEKTRVVYAFVRFTRVTRVVIVSQGPENWKSGEPLYDTLVRLADQTRFYGGGYCGTYLVDVPYVTRPFTLHNGTVAYDQVYAVPRSEREMVFEMLRRKVLRDPRVADAAHVEGDTLCSR